MKKLFTIFIIGILSLVLVGSNVAVMTIADAKIAAKNGDQVWYAPQSIYNYLDWERSSLPGAPFKHDTRVPHGTIDQLTNNLSPPNFEDDWTATVNGTQLQLTRLFPSLSALKTALKAALLTKANEAAAISAKDTAYANSVDEIGTPVLVVSESELDFGASITELIFNITNTGEGKLHWTITTSLPAKVSMSPNEGDTLEETDTITVTVNRDGVSPGTYNPTVSIVSDGGNVGITLTVIVE